MVLLKRACCSSSGRAALFMQRPGMGRLGEPTILHVKRIGIRFQLKRLYHYDGATEPEPLKSLHCAIMGHVVTKNARKLQCAILGHDGRRAFYTAGELAEYLDLDVGLIPDNEGPRSTQVSRKRPMDCVGGHTLNAQQNVYRVPRRGLIALTICAVTTVFGEGKFSKNLVTAHAARDDKTSSNVDVMSHTRGEPLDSKSDSPLNGLFSIFDTTEKTKSGKVLPKGYLKSARQVVKSLKESLKDESGKEADVRRSADSAKEAIRDYLQNWKGQKVVELEDSYKALEDALKALGKFYAKQGPRAVLPSDVKSQILMKLEIVDAAL